MQVTESTDLAPVKLIPSFDACIRLFVLEGKHLNPICGLVREMGGLVPVNVADKVYRPITSGGLGCQCAVSTWSYRQS